MTVEANKSQEIILDYEAQEARVKVAYGAFFVGLGVFTAMLNLLPDVPVAVHIIDTVITVSSGGYGVYDLVAGHAELIAARKVQLLSQNHSEPKVEV